MRTKKLPAILLALCCLLGACSVQKSENTPELPEGTVVIDLSGNGVTVDGKTADGNTDAAVYVAKYSLPAQTMVPLKSFSCSGSKPMSAGLRKLIWMCSLPRPQFSSTSWMVSQ